MNDLYSNFVVACLYCTFAAFSPLVFANDVRVGVSPTTGYYEVTSKTFDVPKGATVSSSRAVSPVVTPLSGGGFQQSMGGGITIEGLKKPAPFTARAAASLQTMKNGAKKLARSNPARFAAAAGVGVLLDSLDWVMKDGAISKTSTNFPQPPFPPDFYRYTTSTKNCRGTRAQCSSGNIHFIGPLPDNDGWWLYCPLDTGNSSHAFVGASNSTCYYGFKPLRPEQKPVISTDPVSIVDIESAIDSSYSPDASDFVLLTPYFPPDFILVDPIPPVQTDLGITNTYDSTGELTGTEQKTSTTEFSISNNSSAQPSISASTSIKTETFKNGQSQGSTVTETTQPATGGGSKVEIPTVEIPTDCDFHPTLCKWLDWTKEEPTEPDLDLKPLLQTTNIEMKSFVFSASDAGCPAPIALDLSFLGSREVSYQPLCDLASTMKPLYLALMAFLSALLISRSINRV